MAYYLTKNEQDQLNIANIKKLQIQLWFVYHHRKSSRSQIFTEKYWLFGYGKKMMKYRKTFNKFFTRTPSYIKFK